MDGQSAVDFPGDRRIHIGLAVRNLERSRRFYEILFAEPPTKQRRGYVKFEPESPSVNLSLNAGADGEGETESTTHFGVQVKSTQALRNAVSRFAQAGEQMRIEEHTTCCYAVQDKAWVTDPDGRQWEMFVVLEADANRRASADSTCCADNCCSQGPAEAVVSDRCDNECCQNSRHATTPCESAS